MQEKEICVFCTKPEIQEREIIGNTLAWTFPTNIPIVPGHVLVAPRRCVATYELLTIEEKQALENVRVAIIEKLKKTFNAQGFNYAWNEGSLAGQTVPHFHLHVLPRKEGDEGIIEYEPRKFLYRPGSREPSPESELLTITKLLREI